MEKKSKKLRVVVGLSGGIDSAMSAYFLKQQGHEVVGLFMQNWDSVLNHDDLGHKRNQVSCEPSIDYEDAKKVAEFLSIPLHRVEFIEEYWKKVFQYFLEEYQKGRTPNPDVLCNKYIKFDVFLEYALKQFNADYIAMGHYARVNYYNNSYHLNLAKDQDKDQTYFLCYLNQKQLSKSLFPIGNYLKSELREIAQKIGLPNAKKKDSTGICFIGERKFKEFLKNYFAKSEGLIKDISNNKILGQHDGLLYYTIGQNRNLSLGGLKEKYYVCQKDLKNNVLYVVSESEKQQYLSSSSCDVESFNWIINPANISNQNILIRFRHRQKFIKGTFRIKGNKVILNYEPTLAVTEGQFAVLYNDDECLGGGIISKVDKSKE